MPARLAQLGRAKHRRPLTPAQQHVIDCSMWMTEPWLADAVVEIAGVTHGTRVLEPSAGTGELAAAALRRGARVDAVEIDAAMAARLRRRFVNEDRVVVHTADFLAWEPALRRFDVAPMNPPFERGQELEHVLHALSLAPRVVAILRLNALAGSARQERLWSRVDVRQVLVLDERPDFGEEARRVGMRSTGAESDFCVVDVLARPPRGGCGRESKPSFGWLRRPT